MDLYERLGLPPDGQVTRCEVRDVVSTSVAEAARAFGLFETVDIEVDAATARSIVIGLLCEYADEWEGSPARREPRAKEAATTFFASIDNTSARFFTNGHFTNGHLSCWNPATLSTYDTGVLILSDRQIACLWIQNDD